ncbi:MAG: glyceraldehyde-3-phosphate dehydrogenase, partial [Bacteroidota bacterium]
MKKLFLSFIAGILIFLSFQEVKSQGFIQKYFVDTTDNAYDVSNFLAAQGGMLIYPVFITEPAVGYGGGLGLIFFHRSKYERETGHLSKLPPSMTMVGGLSTENGTWAGLVGDVGS